MLNNKVNNGSNKSTTFHSNTYDINTLVMSNGLKNMGNTDKLRYKPVSILKYITTVTERKKTNSKI